jgi:TonB family protein
MTHVAAWLVHSLVISLVLAAAAAAWELSARWSGRPVRWAWLGALAGSVSLPLLVRLVPAQAWPQALPSAVPTVLALDPIIVGDATVALSAHTGGWSAGVVGVALWAAMSAVALLLVALLFVQLRLARRGWRTTELDGSLVYVTRDSGPAAIGIRRGIVLVPAWALEMRPELRSLLLLHEHEHIRAGDPRLLLAGLVLLSLMPWNPVLWLQLLRLRNAIELDCDGRVLRAGADPRRYGSLLLEVGRHRSGMAFVMATFAEPHMFLEQRIRRITQWPLERRPRRAAAFSLLALALCATALSARDPLRPALPTAAGPDALTAAAVEQGTERPADTGRGALAAALGTATAAAPGIANAAAAALGTATGQSAGAGLVPGTRPAAIDTPPPPPTPPTPTPPTPPTPTPPTPTPPTPPTPPAPPAPRQPGEPIDARPTFTPMTQRPELQNMVVVRDALLASYPPLLRDAGIGGTVLVWFFIDDEGVVRRTSLSRTSGYAALDEAALAVASIMRFSPALNRDQRVPVWVEIPIVFSLPRPAGADTMRREMQPVLPPRQADPERGIRAVPPATEVARMLNRDDVLRLRESHYPPLLRDAGIGGTTIVWAYIGEQGTVQRLQLHTGSGHDALDQAALRVVGAMRFEPPTVDGRPAAVWYEVPVAFTAR